MKRKATTIRRGMATLCLLALGATVLGIGTTSLDAQSPSPLDTCGSYSGSVCASGEFCLLFFCLDWEINWPETPEESEPGR